MRSRRPRKRGTTLLEATIAAGVLIIGLTGIVAMLVRGMSQSRDGNAAAFATKLANSTLRSITVGGIENLVPGTWVRDGGKGDSSYRTWTVNTTVTAVSDGGINAMFVQVDVPWQDSLLRTRISSRAQPMK